MFDMSTEFTDMTARSRKNENGFASGLKDGLPIALGYLAVSFAFGIFAAEGGMSPLVATLLSLTNVTSAGQFAGVKLIFTYAPWFEIAVTVLLINLRYSLMSLSLSQRLQSNISVAGRMLIGFGVTDEVYAVAILKEHELSLGYMLGLMTLPITGWTVGTLTGSIAGYILPISWRSALGIALYAMFVAIIMPPARRSRPVLMVVAFAAALSVVLEFTPTLNLIPLGWRIIICTITASAAGAMLAPIQTAPTPVAVNDSKTKTEITGDSNG